MSLILDGTTGVPVTTVTGTLPVANGGTGVTTSTGSGANVLGTSPTLTTPVFNSATFATVSGTAPIYGCRAWVKFAGGTGTISASGNVSSVTRDGVGLYRVNFTTEMVDADYSVSIVTTGNSDTANTFSANVGNNTYGSSTTSYLPMTAKLNGNPYDAAFIFVAVFR